VTEKLTTANQNFLLLRYQNIRQSILTLLLLQVFQYQG